MLAFCSQAILQFFFSSSVQPFALGLNLGLLVVVPRVETLLRFGLGQCTLAHTVEEVVVVDGTGVLQNGTSGVRGFSTDLQPVQCTVVHDFDGGRVGVGVVGAELFDETTVALGAGISSYEVVEGFSFLTVTLESEAYSHGRNFLEGSETLLLKPKLERKDSQSLPETTM